MVRMREFRTDFGEKDCCRQEVEAKKHSPCRKSRYLILKLKVIFIRYKIRI